MTTQNAQYGVKEVMNLTFFHYNQTIKKAIPYVYVDYAQVTGLAHESEITQINGGRGNKRLVGFDSTKTVTLNLTLPLVDFRLLSKISGDDIKDKISELFKRESLLVRQDATSNYVVLKKEPLNNTLFVNKLSGYRDIDDSIKVIERGNKNPSENECSIVVENDEIKLYLNSKTCPVDSEIVVHYTYETKGAVQRMEFSGDKFPKYVTIKGDTLFRNQVTTEDEVYNFVAYKCKFQTNFTLNMSATDPTVLELTVDVYIHKDKETQTDLYYEFVKEEEDDVVGNFRFTNLDPTKTVEVKIGTDFVVGVEQENVKMVAEQGKDAVFTVNGLTIKPVGAGTGKVTLKKIGYPDTELNINVSAARR